MHRGVLPEPEIDHIDRDEGNDRIGNLRLASRSEQNANRGLMGNNTSGYRGIYYDARKKLWAARLSAFGKRKRLGMYATAEEAAAVVDAAGRAAFGDYWSAGQARRTPS
jgi:hypothetical protein